MKVVVLTILNHKKNIAEAKIISNENFDANFQFELSNVKFPLRLGQIIFINDNSDEFKFEVFNSELHKEYLNIEKIKESKRSINIMANIKEARFIILNNLHRENKALNIIDYINKNLVMGPLYTPKKFHLKDDIQKLINTYQITYIEHGYNKRGDWSRASISITTQRAFIYHGYENDPYLDKLFPNINIDLGKGEDSIENPFADDILNSLRIGLDGDKIKNECEILTLSIKRLAKLLYNEQKHALALYEYSKTKKWEIINNYEKLANS